MKHILSAVVKMAQDTAQHRHNTPQGAWLSRHRQLMKHKRSNRLTKIVLRYSIQMYHVQMQE